MHSNVCPDCSPVIDDKVRPDAKLFSLPTTIIAMFVATGLGGLVGHGMGTADQKSEFKNNPEAILKVLSEEQLLALKTATERAIAEKTGENQIPE